MIVKKWLDYFNHLKQVLFSWCRPSRFICGGHFNQHSYLSSYFFVLFILLFSYFSYQFSFPFFSASFFASCGKTAWCIFVTLSDNGLSCCRKWRDSGALHLHQGALTSLVTAPENSRSFSCYVCFGVTVNKAVFTQEDVIFAIKTFFTTNWGKLSGMRGHCNWQCVCEPHILDW